MKALTPLICITALAASSSAFALTDQEIVTLMGGLSFVLLTVAVIVSFPIFIMVTAKGAGGHIENQRKEYDEELRRLALLFKESNRRQR